MDGDERTIQTVPRGGEPDGVWRALGDPTRRQLLDELRNGRKSTSELVASVPGMTRFGVMKHLGVLEEAGLVISRKEGRQRWNHLNAAPLRMIYERWVSKYEDQWASSLVRLKQRIERKSTMGAKFIDTPARVAVSEIEIMIDAPKETVYRAWFDSPHDWFYENEDARKNRPTRCEERIGGRFYMELPNGGFNVIGEFTMLKPNHKIRMRGDCTMPQAVLMNMTIAFEDVDGKTRVSIDHRMSGEIEDDFPEGFVEGWTDGLQKLKALVESR
ncbi:MAG: SRPBCC domain-containing protein [Phycisphaerales bacterium]|nr:SRPBCC domain-containing protein [Phycisphaerales bacterium]